MIQQAFSGGHTLDIRLDTSPSNNVVTRIPT